MQDSKSNSGNPFMETGIQWFRFFLFLIFNFFFVLFCLFVFFFVKVARYNTVLARFRDHPDS